MRQKLAGLQEIEVLKCGSGSSKARKELLAFEQQVAGAKENYLLTYFYRKMAWPTDTGNGINSKKPPLDHEPCQPGMMQASMQASQLVAELQTEPGEVKCRTLTALLICIAEQSVLLPAAARQPRGASAEHTQGLTKIKILKPLKELSGC